MRTIALRLLAVFALVCGAPASAAPDDHAGALAALADVRAAVTEIVRIEDGYAVGHGPYLRAAHRAMNALVGRRDDGSAANDEIKFHRHVSDASGRVRKIRANRMLQSCARAGLTYGLSS